MSRQESKSGMLAHGLALTLSVLTVAAMWVYVERMMLQKKQWSDFGTELSESEVMAIRLADLLVNYGYIIAPLTFAIVYAVTLAVAGSMRPRP
jgi:hypothetical protein